MQYNYKIFKDHFHLNYNDNKEFIRTINSIIKNGKFINGKYVAKFENKFSNFIKAKYAVGYSSASTATSALVNLLTDNDCKDEIIVPAYGPIPVSMPLLNYGKKIVYADVNYSSHLLSKNDLLKKYNKKTKLIMPVHLFGNVFDVKDLKKDLDNKRTFVIEDASQAHGSSINKIMAGNLGKASIFSFYPTKNLGAFGDAGVVLTNQKKIYSKLDIYRNYGLHKRDYKSLVTGNNFRMDEIQAIVLLLKMKYLESWNNKRNQIAREYILQLSDLPLKFQQISEGTYTCYHVFSVLVEKKLRLRLKNYLTSHGVQASIYYPHPLPFMTGECYSLSKTKDNFPNAYNLSRENICIPIHNNLRKCDIEYTCDLIRKFFKKI